MKINSSFNSKNYYSNTTNQNPANKSINYQTIAGGVNQYLNVSTVADKRRTMSNTRGVPPQSYNFSTLQQALESPRMITSSKNQRVLKNNRSKDLVNQTIQPCYNREEFQSIAANTNFNNRYDELERALSYNILKTHKTIQQVEKECEIRILQEKQRFKDKENDNKMKIKQLVSKIESEKDKRLFDLTNYTELKKKNLELRKRISELIFENNQVQNQNQQLLQQVQGQQRNQEQFQSQYQQMQQQLSQIQQKMTKKILKRETKIDEMTDQNAKEVRKLQKELQILQQQNKEIEFELYSYKKQGQVSMQDQTIYEERIKQLLLDLETQSKKYINEVNGLHDYYRQFVNRSSELEEKIRIYQQDCESAVSNEREIRKENVRVKLQIDELIKKVKILQKQQQEQPSPQQCKKCINFQTINYSQKQKRPEIIQQKQEPDEVSEVINQKNHKKANNQQDSQSPKPEYKRRREASSQQDQQILQRLVDKIQHDSALYNGHIRRKFSLQNILFKGNKLISKNQMMDELQDYDNLIKAMGALFYASKRAQDQIPCIFQAWKEFSFEQRAGKIRNLLSESQIHQPKQGNNNQMSGTQQHLNDLGSQGMTIQYDNNQSEDYYEDNEDFNAAEEEEFMKIQDSNQSYSILPANNLKAEHLGNNSQYEDGEDEDISIDDDEDDVQEQNEDEEKQKQRWDFNEDDPEVQNAKLLEKYAQMQGANMQEMMGGSMQDEENDQQMIFVDEDGREIDHQTVMMMMGQEGLIQGEDGKLYYEGYEEDDDAQQVEELEDEVYQDIITADDYINDDEEEKAKLIQEKQRKKEKILYQPSTSNEGSAQRKAGKKVQQLAYYEEMDEDGNLYLYEKR
ncbi:UNKNOWN [Stylonychia lemnae]|uniref:Uncharacterized protein n=1 Tax=Stylonychia lemnae TaxID=5949 RepID=A0A078A1I8_STYLE|nr:UNKNOWN [Stylonychia lemnae]|eukprot:CDW74649.1 UNKNOWN [Stylonychia lemnae]